MLKFKTSCAVLAYLSSNLLNEVGLSLFRYFEVGLRVFDIVIKKFTFAMSSPDEFLFSPYDSPGTLVFLMPIIVGGGRPFPLKFALKMTNPLSSTTILTNIGS